MPRIVSDGWAGVAGGGPMIPQEDSMCFIFFHNDHKDL